MSVESQVLELMEDGQSRTAAAVVDALSKGGEFVARRQTARAVQTVLLGLASRGRLRRLAAEGGTDAYVLPSAILPVCFECFGLWWTDATAPNQSSGFAIELCSVCGRRTNNGLYLPAPEVRRVIAQREEPRERLAELEIELGDLRARNGELEAQNRKLVGVLLIVTKEVRKVRDLLGESR